MIKFNNSRVTAKVILLICTDQEKRYEILITIPNFVFVIFLVLHVMFFKKRAILNPWKLCQSSFQ